MSDLQTQPEDAQAGIHVGNGRSDGRLRRQVIDCLRHVPQVWDSLRTLISPTDAYRVIIDADKVGLFKRGADGFYKPFLHDGRKFVGNVNLKKLSPNVVREISNLMMVVNMAAIAADLRAIKTGMIDIERLLSEGIRGEVRGAMGAVDQASALSHADERRHHTLSACQHLSISIGKLSGQLGAHMRAMPEPHSGFFDGLFGSGLDEVDRKWSAVQADLVLLRDGVATLLGTYAELGELETAVIALRGLIAHLNEYDWNGAIRKARLVGMLRDGIAAPSILEAFQGGFAETEQRLLTREMPYRAIAIDLKPEEMDVDQR